MDKRIDLIYESFEKYKDELPNVDTGKKDADGKDTDEIAYRTRQNYGYAEVYNVDQFETIDLPPVPEIPKIEASEAEEEILKRYKDHPPIEFVKMAPGQSPHYTFDKDIIKLPERGQYGDDQLGFIKTLLHELSHSSGHKDRLDRSELFDRIKIEAGLRIDNGPNRATEELMAEIAAAIIGARLGLELDTKHTSAYIKSWIRALNNNRSAIIDAASAAAKIADIFKYDSLLGGGPIQTASSAKRTCKLSESAVEYTATVLTPISLQVLITRNAISPLLAINIFLNIHTSVYQNSKNKFQK